MADGGAVERPACLAEAAINTRNVAVSIEILIDSNTRRQMCEFLRDHGERNPDVVFLDISYMTRDAEFMSMFADTVLPAYSNLKEINLGCTELAAGVVETFVMGLKHHCQLLEGVYFCFTNLDDAGFAVVCRDLPAAHLKDLSIQGTAVTRIPAAFRRFQSLQALYANKVEWSGEWQAPAAGSGNEAAKSALAYAASLPDDDDDDEELMVKPAVHDA